MDAIERLGDEIGELSARVDAATQRLLTCIRQFDEAGGWQRQGRQIGWLNAQSSRRSTNLAP
jgi:hypothetical protein